MLLEGDLQQPLSRASGLELLERPFKEHFSDVPELSSLANGKPFQLGPQLSTDSYADLCFPLAHRSYHGIGFMP